jgi:hypothetical protein
MGTDPIPEEVRDFIIRYIDSIAQLEALLLLRREPQIAWDAGQAGQRLYISSETCTDLLARLCADGFLISDGHVYRYQCRTVALQGVVDRVADFYARHLIPVTHLIHTKPGRIREFAEAFKLRKET